METGRFWQIGVACTAMLIGAGAAMAEPGGGGEGGERKPKREHRGGEEGPPRGERSDRERGEGRGEGREGRRGERGERMARALFRDVELTPEQREQTKAVLNKHREQRRAWMEEHGEEMRDVRRQMREARESGDEAAIAEARTKVREMMEGAPRLQAVADEIRAVLTPEQVQQFDDNLEEMRQRVEEHMLNGPPPGGPGGPPDGEDGERRDRGGERREGPPPREGAMDL